MATILNQNFNGGEALSTLGFIDLDHVANVAATGADGSYAMSWTDGDDLGTARLPITMAGSHVICLSGVWVPQVYTDFRIVALLAFSGISYLTCVQLYTDSANRQIFLQGTLLAELWRSAVNFVTIGDPIYWRLYVRGSTFDGASWASDGELSFWTGASAGALTLQTAQTGLEIYTCDATDPVPYPNGWSHLSFGPQGSLDDLFATNAACAGVSVVADAGDGSDLSTRCCGDTTTGGGVTATDPDPVGLLPPWEASCVGGGAVDSVADLSDGEVWG